MTTPLNSPSKQDTTPEIRVFISSTFQDLQPEREYLVKKVFPGLRKICRDRGIELTEIDLRWGVTAEEAEQGKVVKVCLEEIDRCRPFFIGILGSRYGWSPSLDDITKDVELIGKYPWIEQAIAENRSLTDIEIMHAVFLRENPNLRASFYFRSDDSSTSQSNEPPDAIQKLSELKERIRSSQMAFRENIASPEILGQAVREDMIEFINLTFPLNKIPSPLEKERFIHNAFMQAHRRVYINIPEQFKTITNYVEESGGSPLVLTGESGCGKSALLANWAADYITANPNAFIITHNIGITSTGNDHLDFIWRICSEIKQRYSLPDEIPATAEQLEAKFPIWLARARGEKLIILIDALDKLNGAPEQLRWLPEYLPPYIRLIVSAVESPELDILRSRNWREFKLLPLNKKERESLVKEFLASFGKSLSLRQRQTIAADDKSSNPLFLRTLLEELRVFGLFEHLDRQITLYLTAEDTSDLFLKVLERLEIDFSVDLVRKVAESLWAARRGLSETELLEITQARRMELSALLVALEHHLLRRAGLLSFFHQYLRQAIEQRYLSDISDRNNAHLRLARYFETIDMSPRKTEELPWQLLRAGEHRLLVDTITDIPMFLALHTDKKRHELLGYWLSVGYDFRMLDEYRDKIAKYELEINNPIELSAALGELGEFFKLSGDYDSAESLLRRSLMLRNKHLGPIVQETLDSLNRLGSLLVEKGNYTDAESLLHTALLIAENMYGTHHPIVAGNLNEMGMVHFAKGDYAAAEPLLKRSLNIRSMILGRNHPFVAQSWNNMGLLHLKQGDLDTAEEQCSRAIEIQKTTIGEGHPDSASALSNLAMIYRLKTLYERAEAMYRELLALWEAILGNNHPETANALHDLGELLYEKGDYSQAEDVLRRSLSIRERTLGTEHPATANTLQALAELYSRVERFDDAEHYFRRAIATRQMSLGMDHPETAQSLHAFAEFLVEKGDISAAATPVFQAYSIRLRLEGDKHPDTIKSQHLFEAITEGLK
ncbi:MAG: tetratricopeptide repeat protein [Ignavibacteriae bacterium]|nr:tetratricopeptide repeat protein [Ignavibacteriota bacterium]